MIGSQNHAKITTRREMILPMLPRIYRLANFDTYTMPIRKKTIFDECLYRIVIQFHVFPFPDSHNGAPILLRALESPSVDPHRIG